MSFSNFYGVVKKTRKKDQFVKSLIFIILILISTLSILNIHQITNRTNYFDNHNEPYDSFVNIDNENLKMATDTSMLQNPYSTNFDVVRTFFESKYQSDLSSNVPTYFRYGDTIGTIIDDTIYSEDNLLIYYSLMKSEVDQTETFDIYLKLKSTPLWYEDTSEPFHYGFARSVDDTTGLIKDSNRHLIDNLLPIFLLIENIGEDIDVITIDNQKPVDQIDEMFDLISSSEFWDTTNEGFRNYNSSIYKYSESNFLAILANLLIHRTYSQQNLPDAVKTLSYYLANRTMISMENMWDSDDNAYYYFADANWDTFSSGQEYYHLNVNALGILTLLEYWIETGKVEASPYLKRAKDIYDSLDFHLWNTTFNAYHNVSSPGWSSLSNSNFDLKANSLMLEACLKLFEFTGNFTYYDRAVNISKSFENNFYDSVNNAYKFSLTDSSKNLNSNLVLHKSYLVASEIFYNTILESNYNITETIPSFLIDQDVMNLTSFYAFRKESHYYDPGEDSYVSFILNHTITNTDINYLFKYPNGTFLYKFEKQITDPATNYSLIHPIEESLPIGDGYYIYIWANKSYFNMADNLKRFNVASGLINETIEGLPEILFQGQTLNVTLLLNNTRSEDLTLIASLEGDDIISYPSREINFTALTALNVSFDLTAKFGISPGPSKITFNIKRGNVTYLSIIKVIEIGYSFNYEHLIYQSKIVSGQSIQVSLKLINFLPNATQSLNVSFTGMMEDTIESFIQEETINKDETKSVSYYLQSFEDINYDSIKIEMNILQNNSVYYTEEMNVEIIPEFEIISVNFPHQIPQGSYASLIIIIQNNKDSFESFSLLINGEKVQTNINELSPGENWVIKSFIPTINPYEYGSKIYRIVLKDSENEEIVSFYFRLYLELSTFNLVMFYLLPSIIPVAIVLYFLSKNLKNKKLKR